MGRHVDDEQAALMETAIHAQRKDIVAALDRLAQVLGFDDDASEYAAPTKRPPDVLRARHRGEHAFLFVGIARGFGEPADDPRHRGAALRWLHRFARLLDKRPRKGAPRIDGGYLVVGTRDAAAAHAWAVLLTTTARTHRIQRDGKPVRFAVRRLGDVWMAC
jgi:hypothetical protein